jgi:hypothetical protein
MDCIWADMNTYFHTKGYFGTKYHDILGFNGWIILTSFDAKGAAFKKNNGIFYNVLVA